MNTRWTDFGTASMNRLREVYTAFGLLLLCGAIFPVLKASPTFAFAHPHLLHKLSIALVIAVGSGFAYLSRKQVQRDLKGNPALAALFGWMVMSLIWTEAPHSRGLALPITSYYGQEIIE